MKPVVILGAGLAGLACAKSLSEQGKTILVLEAKPKVGGRVSSFRTEKGFLVDEGFQVLLSSYPELKTTVSLDSLHLESFNSGALIFNGERLDLLANPFRHPQKVFRTLSFPYASFKDKALVVSLLLSSQRFKTDTPLGKISTLEFLRKFGFSPGFIENFWRPFLGGVYLDSNLSIGSHYFQFLVWCFGWGKVCLPAGGMEQLPLSIAYELPKKSIRINSPVRSWTAKEVILESGETIEASQVVCAFDEKMNSSSSGEKFRQVTTYYFTSPELAQLGWEKWLVLVPPRLGMAITHMALISSVSKAYSTSGEPLLSVSAIGSKEVKLSRVTQEVEQVAGKRLGLDWVATTQVPRALPVITGETSGFEIREGVVYCGDRYASPSINGALRSGRMAAESLRFS